MEQLEKNVMAVVEAPQLDPVHIAKGQYVQQVV